MCKVEQLGSLLLTAGCAQQMDFLLEKDTAFSLYMWSLVEDIASREEKIGEVANFVFHPINKNGRLSYVVIPKDPKLKKVFNDFNREKWVSEMTLHFSMLGFLDPDKAAAKTFNILKGYVPELRKFKDTSIVFNKLVQDLQRQPEEWHLKKAGVKTRINKAVIRCLRKLYS